MTKKHKAKEQKAKERFAAEMEAYRRRMEEHLHPGHNPSEKGPREGEKIGRAHENRKHRNHKAIDPLAMAKAVTSPGSASGKTGFSAEIRFPRPGAPLCCDGTVIHDPTWRGRVAHRIRMTKKHNERARQDKERFAAEMEAYRRSGEVLRRK
jgi:hypothetical protein